MARQKGPKRPPAPKKPALTHFLCLPLVTPTSRPQLEASVAQFRDDVCQTDTDVVLEDGSPEQSNVSQPVHPKAIRPVGALHCTLGVMSLKSNELLEVIDFLKGVDIQQLLKQTVDTFASAGNLAPAENETAGSSSVNQRITPPNVERSTAPLTVDLKGLVSMHALEKTSILYSAPEDATGRLYPFCVALQKLFKDKGFMVEDNRELKLHATIVNTIYAKGKARARRCNLKPNSAEPGGESAKYGGSADRQDARSQGHGPNANAPLKIDATAILRKYKDFVWAENVVLDRVAICEMGAKKTLDEDGNVKAEEYTEVAAVALST